MKYRVRHTTRYAYGEPVTLCHNEVHLRPRTAPRQTCRNTQLEIQPLPDSSTNRTDYFGNFVDFFTVQERHTQLEVSCMSEVTVDAVEPPMANLCPAWEDVAALFRSPEAARHLEAAQFTLESMYVRGNPTLEKYASESFTPHRPLLEGTLDLMRRINKDFVYDSRATTLLTPVMEVFEKRRGVCQDFAHLMLACLRSLGLPGRYVSGYLQTTAPAGKERLVGADASHAWLSVYSPGIGWVDVDPTNALVPSDQHIVVAWGRDYADVSPIKGVILGGGQHTLDVSVDVEPI